MGRGPQRESRCLNAGLPKDVLTERVDVPLDCIVARRRPDMPRQLRRDDGLCARSPRCFSLPRFLSSIAPRARGSERRGTICHTRSRRLALRALERVRQRIEEELWWIGGIEHKLEAKTEA